MILNRLFGRSPGDDAAAALYEKIVAQARHPRLYSELGVPDTLDGRFDMIVLHAFLVMHRLKAGEAHDLSQRLFDAMFADMDRALREMGVGDLSVPGKVKKMASAFCGRVQAYDAAVEAGSEERLKAVLLRNIFSEEGADETQIAALAHYVRTNVAALSCAPVERLQEGAVEFCGP